MLHQQTRTYALWSVSIALVVVLGGLGWRFYSKPQQTDVEPVREVSSDESQNTQSMLEKYFTANSETAAAAAAAVAMAPDQRRERVRTPATTLTGNALDASVWTDFVSLMPDEFKDELMKCPGYVPGMLCVLEKLMFDKESDERLTNEERIAIRDKLVAAFFLMRGIRRRGEGKKYRDVITYDPETGKVVVTDPELLKELKQERDRPNDSKKPKEVNALKPEEGIPLGWLFGLLRSMLRRKGRQMREGCKICASKQEV
jgi:hypothetical protein